MQFSQVGRLLGVETVLGLCGILKLVFFIATGQLLPGLVEQKGFKTLLPGCIHCVGKDVVRSDGVVAMVSIKVKIPVVDLQRRIPGCLKDSKQCTELSLSRRSCQQEQGTTWRWMRLTNCSTLTLSLGTIIMLILLLTTFSKGCIFILRNPNVEFLVLLVKFLYVFSADLDV